MNRRHLSWTVAGALAAAATLACPAKEDPIPSGPLVFPDEPFRSTPPPAGPARAFEPPRPQVFTLPSGVEVYMVERRSLPLVRWFIVFPSGSVTDPPGKEGLAALCMNVVFQGSKGLDRTAREQALADVAATIDVTTGVDDISFRGECLRPDLESTLQMWSDLFLQPALEPAIVNAVIRSRMMALSTGPSLSPTAVASRVSSRLFWGMAHPMAREPTMESYGAATLADCQAFVANLRHMGAKLFVAGDITRAEVEEKFGARLAPPAVPAGLPPLVQVPPPTPAVGALYFVDSPGAPQSVVSLRAPGPARTSEEYFAAQMMASILAGNSITSRIGMNVREMKGYAYSTNGGFVYEKTGSYFDFSAPVVKEATAQSVFEVLEEIRRMRDEDVTEEELTRERDGFIGGYPYGFETGTNILGAYYALTFYGLPVTYLATYAENMAKVNKAAIRQVAAQYLAPASLQIVVVGDGASVLPKLRELATQRPDLMGREVVTLDVRGNRI
jgi:zinc protease